MGAADCHRDFWSTQLLIFTKHGCDCPSLDGNRHDHTAKPTISSPFQGLMNPRPSTRGGTTIAQICHDRLVRIDGGNFLMRATENVLSIVRSQPEVDRTESVSDVPNLSFDDANGLVEIEAQANQLLDYISKLSSLADRACVTAIRQTET